jgi:branched-subunit amino acid ABC-type transport system permease component
MAQDIPVRHLNKKGVKAVDSFTPCDGVALVRVTARRATGGRSYRIVEAVSGPAICTVPTGAIRAATTALASAVAGACGLATTKKDVVRITAPPTVRVATFPTSIDASLRRIPVVVSTSFDQSAAVGIRISSLLRGFCLV